MRRLHKAHIVHTRNSEPPLVCKFYSHSPEHWICPACLAVTFRHDPIHARDEGCRYGVGGQEVYRRIKKQFGVKAKAGPIRDPAIPAAGDVDINPVSDDVDLDADNCAIRVPGAISAPDGVISTPGAISAPDGVLSTPGVIGPLKTRGSRRRMRLVLCAEAVELS